MNELFQDFGPVQWFTEQFEDPSAASIFRLVLISWVVAGAAYIGLDRLAAMLLGRSRPLAQAPPTRARAWRWGRHQPPSNYSLLPPGTTVTSSQAVASSTAGRPARAAAPLLLERPSLVEAEMLTDTIRVPDPAGPLDDKAFWQLFDEQSAPVFGYENGPRLAEGQAPERYNPVTRRVETLGRHQAEGILLWDWSPNATTIVEGKT